MKLKLKEIVPNQVWDDGQWCCVGFQPGTDSIQMFSVNGSPTNVVTYVTKEALENIYYNFDAEPGWYDIDEVGEYNFSNPKGECYVNYGEGYVVKSGMGAGVIPTLTYSGEVKQNVTEIPGLPFMFSGNCTPVSFNLEKMQTNQAWDDGQWCCTGFQPGTDSVQIFNKSGHPEYAVTFVTIEALQNIYYNFDAQPGWYDIDEVGEYNFDNPLGKVISLNPGEAFVLKCSDGAGVQPTITIPNPMASTDAE